LPRAISVARASKCGVQNRRKRSSHASTSRSGAESTAYRRPLRAHDREPGVPQHLQMLRHGGLRYPELLPDDGRHLPGGPLAVGEQFQDPAADRITQHIECVHGPNLQSPLI
jgi:hypothetical protein